MSPFSNNCRFSKIENNPFRIYPFYENLLFHFSLDSHGFFFSVLRDCRLSAVSAAAATPQKPIRFEFPEQIRLNPSLSSVCETSNRRLLCSFREFKYIYEFDWPVVAVAGDQLPILESYTLPATFKSMSIGNRDGTDQIWCSLEDNSIREFRLFDGKLTEQQRFQFSGNPLQIFFDEHRNYLFLLEGYKRQELFIAAKESNQWKV